MDDWGTYPFDFYMENFQDLCVSGDLFFLFPLTMHLGIGNFIQTYSLSQKTLLADDTVDFGFSDDITINEPEGLCETNPGEFIAIVNVTKADGGRYVQFYRTRVRICSRFPLPRRSMARCPRAGKFPAERKNRFLHGRRRLPAREALGGRLVSAGDGISGQLHIFRYPEGSYPCRNV